jgi:DNA mismatch repair protein MutS
VVEQSLAAGASFVPNSFALGVSSPGDDKSRTCDLMILCGPNSSGKSCAIRTVGLIVVLAQVGCLVPASRARLGVTDRIFTRVGAVDDVSQGQSTFQVETSETAVILSQATPQSLVLLDEIGRGTAVADGISIAWAVAEYMAGKEAGANATAQVDSNPPRVPRTIFVTHYHELNELALLPNVLPFRMQMVRASLGTVAETAKEGDGDESEGEWVCTHRILPGACYESHGVAIARRAGFPPQVIARAEQVFDLLREPSKELARHLRESCRIEDNPYSNDDRAVTTSSCGESGNQRSNGFDAGYDAGFADGRNAALQELVVHISALQSEST